MRRGIDIIRHMWHDPLDIDAIQAHDAALMDGANEECKCKGWTHQADCDYWEQQPYGISPLNDDFYQFMKYYNFWWESWWRYGRYL